MPLSRAGSIDGAMIESIMKERPIDELTQLVGRASMKDDELRPHRILRPPSTTGISDIFAIRSGLAWLYKVTSGGQQIQVVALRFPGDLVLPAELRSGYGVQALVASKVTAVAARDLPTDSFKNDACRLLLAAVERQHRIALQWLVRGTFEAAGKVAHLLCEVAERSGHVQQGDTPFSLPLTQHQIAAITGQTAVNVNRVLASFSREGVLARTGRRRYTANWGLLRRLGRFDPTYLH